MKLTLLGPQPWQWRVAFAGLCGICVLVRPASAASGRKFLNDQQRADPGIKWIKLPGVPSDEMVVENNEAAETATKWAETAELTSAMRAQTAANMEEAAKSKLFAETRGLQLKSDTQIALMSAQRAEEMRKRALAAAARAGNLVAEMPGIARQAANRAIDAAVNEAIERMNVEATHVAVEQEMIEKKLAKEAAQAAQLAALPWQQAKIRSAQTMISYVSQARDLANAVTHLRLKAPQLSKQAGILQSRGDVVHAQQYQIAAKDVLDKADQLASQAASFSKIGNKINGGLGMFDLSAKAAAAYASYTANPGGGVGRTDLPQLPFPLHLVNLGGPSPGPAPAPGR